MTKHLFVFFLGMSLFVCAFAQPTSNPVADSLLKEGELITAIEAYYETFQAEPNNRSNTYNLACALSLDKQIDTAFYYLELATANDSSVHALNDPDLYFLTKDERWAGFENRLIERVEAKHGKYKDLELCKELWRMRMKDQAFYYQLKVAQNKLGYDSPVIEAIWEVKHMINEENVARITEIIDSQGWPKKSEVKGSAAGAVFLIVQHADIEVQKKYLPIMRAAADEGEASWRSLALLIDRVNLREGKEQIYGSQVFRNDEGVFYVGDLKDPEYVNQRREEVGLGPIEDYVKQWGIEWTVEQKRR